MSYAVIGNFNSDSAVGRAVFGEIADGRVKNAAYLVPWKSNPKTAPGRLALRAIKYCKWHHILPKIVGWYGSVGWRRVKKALDGRNDVVIYCPSTHPFTHIPEGALDVMRRKLKGCKFVYCFVDGVERTAMINHVPVKRITDFVRQFDAVITYDREDAAAFGYAYVDIPIWRSEAPAPDVDSDIYFCGRDKQRADLLYSVYNRLRAAGLKCRYHVVGSLDSDYARQDITFTDWVPYPDVVAELRASGCVLEMIAAQNRGATLRYKEAVMYNKKLLTNNPDLEELPYYDPRYMHFFQTAEDIDIEWLRRGDAVDYAYRGEFSAEQFLKNVSEVLNRKE